ncbi:UDP-galactopyranose mutase [Niabella pedocola]|uniref:UDP-galactopyranose mutase n=1 Tax=Niabella pedocola TaxID=1752077 RepID=A0ABS8PZ39_9BACT|nr:UDP-galactopyranose mutase [Niabella pedocola]MCD2425196.1 UDP-galactopyranose mutase [Niabella pedocola]
MGTKNFLIVGAGFSGAIIANELATKYDHCTVHVIDERDHIGGNCYTKRDEETSIMEHVYGPHIFHTDKQEVWDYVSRFIELVPFVNRVKCIYKGTVYSLPVNLHTINQFFRKNLNPKEAEDFIKEIADHSIKEPQTFEEQALRFIGKDLYEAFFLGYTKKQWGCEPKELPASILKRLPVRFNYNDNYYNSPLQGIPRDGYTPMFEQLLAHPKIQLELNKKFDPLTDYTKYDHVFFSGPIDAYFEYEYGRLSYRTVFFEKMVSDGDHQGNAVINYSDLDVPFTRITEHKHFTPWEKYDKTIYFKEYSKETEHNDIPYYPKRLQSDLLKLKAYKEKAGVQSKTSFVGRLGTYKYMDMHQVIYEALTFASLVIDALRDDRAIPVFLDNNSL